MTRFIGEPLSVTAAHLRRDHPGTDAIEAAYDRIAPEYDALHSEPDDLGEDEWIKADLGPHLVPGLPLAELGSGTGLLLDLLDIPPDDYMGLELSAGMIAEARRKHPRHLFLHRDMHSIGVVAKDFPVVVALFGVIEHSPIPNVLIDEVAKALNRGGLFYAVVATAAHVADPDCAHNTYLPAGSLIGWDPVLHPYMLDAYFTDLQIVDIPSEFHPGHYIRFTARRR